MNTLAPWNAQPIAVSDTQVRSTTWRWKPVYSTRVFVVLAWTMSFTVMLRAASIWNLTAMDNGVEARAHIQGEIVRWISQQPASSAKACVIACGSIQWDVLDGNSWVEAMIDDPSKPVGARLCICRFTLDSSGNIIDMVEKGIPGDPR